MIQVVFSVCLSVFVIAIVANPVPQVISGQNSPFYQQNVYQNPNSAPTCKQPASQNNPYIHTDTTQHQTHNNAGFNGNLNQLLISKIFENPCLQKILDPNTRLYNQNGEEIQRHPKGGSAPNVINNYFIVPPEFFSFNNTQTENKVQNAVKRKKNNISRKTNRSKTKTKTNVVKNDSNSNAGAEKPSNLQTEAKRTKNRQRKQKGTQSSAKIVELNSAVKSEDGNNTNPIIKKAKRKRKDGSSNKTKVTDVTTPEIGQKSHEQDIEAIIDENISGKRPRKSKTKVKITPLDSEDIDKGLKSEDSRKNKKGKQHANIEDSNDNIAKENLSQTTQLKNIELPIDNRDISKDLTENRKTRNSKNNKTKKDKMSSPTFTPIPDDLYRSLFPYMYFSNNLYPNTNYPYNFDQIFQPYLGSNMAKIKKPKNKRKQNEDNNQESLPNVVEVPLKLKTKSKSTTSNPTKTESTEMPSTQLDYSSSEYLTTTIKPTTDIPVVYDNKASTQSSDEEYEPPIPKPTKVTKANLEMPPTVIEDLHNYITPELEIKDMIPTRHTNGIINDYYPIFNDDSYYSNDESYYFTDIENDRHFYTTDRGHEELLNRDRRKYDKNDDNQVPTMDIKDRINFRRGNKSREPDKSNYLRDDAENLVQSPYTHAKLQDLSAKSKNVELKFHTPPPLENPDFHTKKVEIASSMSNKNNDAVQEPVYTGDSIEYIEEKLDSPDLESNRIVNSDNDIRKERVPSKHVRPKNDHIETVFAKTRVVKYGIAREDSEENTSISMPTYDDGNESKFYSDGHTTFVLAKSLGHTDDYFW